MSHARLWTIFFSLCAAMPATAPLWTFTFGNRDVSDPIVDGNRVYVAIADWADAGHVFAFDAPTGRKLWDRKLDTSRDPLATGGRLIYLASDKSVHAVEGATGQELWRHGPVVSLLAATPDATFVLDPNRTLTALDRDGRVLHQTRIESPECYSAAVQDGVLVLNCAPASPLQAFDANTLRPLWSANPNHVYAHLAHGLVYAWNQDAITGLDAHTGAVRWTYAVRKTPDARAGAKPELIFDPSDPTLYVLVFDIDAGQRYLRQVDSRTGVERATTLKLPWKQEWLGKAAIANRTLYITRYKGHDFLSGFNGHQDQALSAVDLGTGKERWRSPWKFEWLKQPATSQGRIFVTSHGEQQQPSLLYAF